MKRLLFVAAATVALLLAATWPASAQYQPMFITVDPTVVEVGGTIVVTAGYFEPGSDVQIRVESDPVVLGTLVADANGVVTSAYALPLSVQVGSHVVFALGPRLGTGVATEVSAAITVIDSDVGAGALTPTTTTSTSGSLPVTGAAVGGLLTTAAVLLAAGGLVITAKRKREAARS